MTIKAKGEILRRVSAKFRFQKDTWEKHPFECVLRPGEKAAALPNLTLEIVETPFSYVVRGQLANLEYLFCEFDKDGSRNRQTYALPIAIGAEIRCDFEIQHGDSQNPGEKHPNLRVA